MKNYRFIRIARSFKEEEFGEFYDFVRSPYYNKQRDYRSILKSLKRLIDRGVDLEKFSPKEFYQKTFEGKNYNNKSLRNRFNELLKLAERYITVKEYERSAAAGKKFLLNYYKSRGLDNMFISEFKKIAKQYTGKHIDSPDISEIFRMNSELLLRKRSVEAAFDDYKKFTDHRLKSFLETLFIVHQEYAIQKTYAINPEVNIADDILNSLDTEKLIGKLESRNDPSDMRIILNYYVYKSLSRIEDEQYFFRLKEYFLKNLDMLDDAEKTNIFSMMNNYCIMKINAGRNDYLNIVFEILDIKFSIGLVAELKELHYPSVAFRDYVIFGVRLGKFEWVEEFISKYSSVIPEEIREEETIMAYSRLYFFKGEYDRALESVNGLNTLKSVNYLATLDAYRTRMMLYYELSYFEQAFMDIDKAKHYIKNNFKRIPAPIRAYMREFIQFYTSLLKLKLNPSKTEAEFLTQKIQISKIIPSRDWFKSKTSEFSGFRH